MCRRVGSRAGVTGDHKLFILDTDASDTGIGAVLLQVQDGHERVIAYTSKMLHTPQRRYCTTKRKLLAVMTNGACFVKKNGVLPSRPTLPGWNGPCQFDAALEFQAAGRDASLLAFDTQHRTWWSSIVPATITGTWMVSLGERVHLPSHQLQLYGRMVV